MLQHSLAPIRSNDTERDPVGFRDPVAMGLAHCTGVESRDLVVVLIGSDGALGGVKFRNLQDVRIGNVQFDQA